MIHKSNLNEEELQKNYQEFVDELLPTYFSGERLKKLKIMYSEKELGLELCTAPASMSEHYHNSFVGGYILHCHNVLKAAFIQQEAWKVMGCDIDYTEQELAFSSLHHDLGKIGSKDGCYYLPQNEDWKSKRGELYRMNPNIQYMEVPMRAIYNLQYYGIKITQKEMLSVMLSDGMYSEGSQKYLKTFNKDMYLKSNLPRIIHAADYMATRGEYDTWMNEKIKLDI